MALPRPARKFMVIRARLALSRCDNHESRRKRISGHNSRTCKAVPSCTNILRPVGCREEVSHMKGRMRVGAFISVASSGVPGGAHRP